jgi:hypothetical protein
MKTCNRCNCNKPSTEFYKKPTAKDGLFWWCKDCHRNHVKLDYHKKAESEAYRISERLRINKYHAGNPEKVAHWNEKYRLENTAKLTAKAKRYVLSREKRTPSWLTSDDFWLIEQAYELAFLRTKTLGFQWQVDHVIPLHGRLVSGLHVPHNLQVIPAAENRSKSNKFVTN